MGWVGPENVRIGQFGTQLGTQEYRRRVLVQQGPTFTVVAETHFTELSDAERDDPGAHFISARRVYLAAAPGSDWLHDGAAEQIGPSGISYSVDTRRGTTQIGAGGEAIEVVAVLYVLAEHTELGRRLQGDLYEWAKRAVSERRKRTGFGQADPAADLSQLETDTVVARIRGELADVAKVPAARLELVSVEEQVERTLSAVFHDSETGRKYSVEVGHDDVVFNRIDG